MNSAKTPFLTALALLLGASGLSLANTPATAAAPAAHTHTASPLTTSPLTTPPLTSPVGDEVPPFCEWAPGCLKLFNAERDGKENPWVQEFSAKLRAQYQWGSVDPNGGSSRVKGGKQGNGRRHNDEWRRVRLGAQAKVFRHFTLCTVWNVGGLDTRNQYRHGGWEDGCSDGVVEELYLRTTLKPVTLTLGKHKPGFIGEYRASSAHIVTIERSAIVNQLTPAKLYGISARNADKKAALGWEFGGWLNSARDNEWASPVFSTASNMMLGMSLNYATGDHSRLYLDYMRNFYKESCETTHGHLYEGAGAHDVLALTWEARKDRLSFMAEAVAGFNLIGIPGAENVYGLVLIPSYRITPHVEGVFRYQLSAGSNAVTLDSRYATTNGDFAKTCDLMHGLYFGANYYVCPENPDALRLMAGVEYINSQGKAASGEKGFSGWNYSVAARVNF